MASWASRWSGWPSLHDTWIPVALSMAGRSIWNTISLGTALATPTRSRIAPPVGRPFNVSCSSRPSRKISSA